MSSAPPPAAAPAIAPPPATNSTAPPPAAASPPPAAAAPPPVSSPPPVAAPPPSNSTLTPPVPAPASPPPAIPPSSPPPSSPPPPASSPPPSAPAPPLSPPTATPPASPPPAPTPPAPSTPSVPSPQAPPPVPSSPPSTPSAPSPPPATPSVPSPPAPPPVTSSPPVTPSVPSPPAPKLPPPKTTAPPPPKSAAAPPPPSNSVSAPLVVGVVVGVVATLAVLGLIWLYCRRKRRRGHVPPSYSGGPPPPIGNPLGGQPQNWQHNALQPADHIVKIPPQPSAPPFLPQPTHPPPPILNSSGGTMSNGSGSEIRLSPLPPGLAVSYSSKSTFTYEELAMATDEFSDANLLGQGGFGFVHKGTLTDGKEVAVKQLKSGSGQGEREFQAEVEIISRVHHRHLVSLVGYCISGDRRLLVYEYVPNGTLEFHLLGKGRPTMDWSSRLKIALGSAKGLAYLHEDCYPKIIHRDIKASNILLDFNFEAKVADFGLAKFTSDNNTHISTRVMGSFGYIAPEYVSSGRLTDKSDVYSFGVMLLELITGKRAYEPIRDDSLVEWARPLLTQAIEDGDCDALVDPRLEKNYNPDEMAHMIACAAACVRHSARHRPRMSQIVRALEGDMSLEDLNKGVRPGHSRAYGSYDSSDYDSNRHSENKRMLTRLALDSQQVPSSEYSVPTSEYGQNPSISSSEAQQTREKDI